MPKKTGDNIQRHNDRGQQGDLAKDTVRARPLRDTIDGELSEVVAMGAQQHLFEVAKVRHHGYNVILDVTEIETDVHPRRHLIVLIATLGETLEDVSLASKQPHKAHDILAGSADFPQELSHVVGSRDEDVVLNLVGFLLQNMNDGRKAVDNVVTGNS